MEALPPELVELILNRLDFFRDRIRARVVCKKWQGLADQGFSKTKRGPWPAIPKRSEVLVKPIQL